ncbi:SANT and BTB domain regulator of class switch recombination [Hylaeus anthracinus]|uniref:SANT and BTB domain regulator of class switch recombination n=1 Tax=Hylaeus anthracinus TaxID=313031 RepID=UPI0023B97BD2|nr:SANT and BTB domain regulator of class switch recombination [Hylaeus anthracinus]
MCSSHFQATNIQHNKYLYLLSKMELNKINDISFKTNIHKLLGALDSTTAKDLSDILQKLRDNNHPKLTVGMFFEFMKVAYQVGDNCESLTTMLTTDKKLDWNKLAKINICFESQNHNISDEVLVESSIIDKNISTDTEEKILCETFDNNVKNCMHPIEISNVLIPNEQIHSYEQNTLADVEKYNEIAESIYDTKVARSIDKVENLLITLIKTNLSDILHEGLLDSVLPYLIPKSTISQPIIKKSITNTELKKCNSLSNNIETSITNVMHKEKDKNKTNKKTIENEVEIHVCDEEKNIKKNFYCPQKLLIKKMRYFADLTAGQKLEDIDISVHCDIVIFDWLMRWVKKDIIKKPEWPTLEPSNVIPIMVSASFLQMEPLLENCLQYCHDNMSDILKTSTILTCLDDNLLTRLVERFTNEDVEALKDKKDKIQSKLFCKLIMSLAEVMPDNRKGHYSSLATLFKCSKCGKSIIQSVSNYVPCISSAMVIDSHGYIRSKHIRDLSWSLDDYIITLRTELRSWRKVYWRLWGDCHYLFCTQCNIYFSINQIDWCCCHAEHPQFFINEQQRSMPFPLGRYPCCSQRAYRFEVLPNREGCRYREHIPDIKAQKDMCILNIFTIHREIIATDPPQLFFPERITRLVACDTSTQLGKLVYKDIMWWVGIDLTLQRPKFGLLGKLWSGLRFRRSSQIQDLQKSLQKIHQISVTDTSSFASSVTDSDEEDDVTIDEDSIDESYNSEESHAWSTLRSKNKIKKKLRNQTTYNGRSWSSNLKIRHNQDNQREFEEKTASQMIAILIKIVSADSFISMKSSNKHNRKKNQLCGGTYARLEAEFRDQLNQSYKSKNITGKYFLRVKSNKS